MNSEVYQLIKKYADLMMEQDYPVGDSPKLIVKAGSGIFSTRDGADLAALKPDDIIDANSSEIEVKYLKESDEMNGLVISKTPYCQKCLKQGKEFKAVLDDMAQIVGAKAVIIPKDAKSLKKALKAATGCFVETSKGEGYTVTVGRNLYESVVAMTVLEKSAEVFLKAEVLGGGKPIGWFDAKLMRYIYKKKYSKAEQAVKTAEGKEA